MWRHLANLFIDGQQKSCTCALLKQPRAAILIRRFLIILFASLIWTVQTADAATHHTPGSGMPGSAEVVMVWNQDGGTDDTTDPGIGCGAGCICYVFHHAVMDDAVQLVQPVTGGDAFSPTDSAPRPFGIVPPTRPPLA